MANNSANSHEKKESTVTVEFILVDGGNPLTDEECLLLKNTAESVRTAARIVDMPCNEMNTDHFLQVNISLYKFITT